MKRLNNKGITLIALVITIIVLLILAGVTIATLTGENGILTKATEAKTNTEIASEKEAIGLAYNASKTNNKGGDVTDQNLNDEFDINGTNAKAIDNGDGTITVIFNDSLREYTIASDGNITGPIVGESEEDIWNYFIEGMKMALGEEVFNSIDTTNFDFLTYEFDAQTKTISSANIELINIGGYVAFLDNSNENINMLALIMTYGKYKDDIQNGTMNEEDMYQKLEEMNNSAERLKLMLSNKGLTDYDFNKKAIIIPSQIDGVDVEVIGENCFKGDSDEGPFSGFSCVIIPDTVKRIEESAFSYAAADKYILSNSLVEIGAHAFQGNDLTEIEIPNYVTTIGDYAFAYNDLIELKIPDSVTTLGEGTFAENPLTNVVFEGVPSTIGTAVFTPIRTTGSSGIINHYSLLENSIKVPKGTLQEFTKYTAEFWRLESLNAFYE